MTAAKKKIEVSVNMALLHAIGSGQVTHVTQDEAMSAGMTLAPPLIEVDTSAVVDGKAAVRLSEAGKVMLHQPIAQPADAPSASPYAIISNATLPASKRGNRGGGGAPKKYPFDTLEVGASFFVAATEKVPDPVKKLGSTVSSANMRFAEPTGESKPVERTKRGPGNKAVKDAAGNNIRETVVRPVLKQTRKFAIRPVTAGEKYGEWVAPADGALIGRTL